MVVEVTPSLREAYFRVNESTQSDPDFFLRPKFVATAIFFKRAAIIHVQSESLPFEEKAATLSDIPNRRELLGARESFPRYAPPCYVIRPSLKKETVTERGFLSKIQISLYATFEVSSLPSIKDGKSSLPIATQY